DAAVRQCRLPGHRALKGVSPAAGRPRARPRGRDGDVLLQPASGGRIRRQGPAAIGNEMAGINDPGEIDRALKTAKTIAVVGCSPEETRPSHAIARYLLSAGFDVIPVNPGHSEILGRPCYPDLARSEERRVGKECRSR